MPYTSQSDRIPYEPFRFWVNNNLRIKKPSDLAYLHALLINVYMKDKQFCWDELTNVIKAADSTIDELRRRFLHPYETAKIESNGEVFSFNITGKKA